MKIHFTWGGIPATPLDWAATIASGVILAAVLLFALWLVTR
jgi:hypothetical protein